MEWLVAASVLAALFAVDRLGCWAQSRGWIYWRRRRKPGTGGGAVSGAFGEMEALLSPSYRHVIDEQRSRATLGEQQESGDGVDLDSGVISLRRPPTE